jgi:hypothetical protein
LLIRELGFYWDDWPAAWFTHVFGSSGFQAVFESDRPLLGRLYQLTTPLMGTSALRWQAFGLLARWLSVCLFWLVLLSIWPYHRWQATTAALLFLVYPGFSQQPITITYSHVWLLLGVFLLSLLVMLWAAWRPRWYWPLNFAGWLLSAASLFTVEYFFGLEFLRPVLLWLVYAHTVVDRRARLRKTVLHWLPYLVIDGLFLVWRLFLTETPRGQVSIFSQLASSPLDTLFRLLTDIQEALIESSFTAWGRIFGFQHWFNFTDLAANTPILTALLAVSLVAGLLVFLLKVDRPVDSPPSRWNSWGYQAMAVGLLAMVFAGIPFWMTGLPVRLQFPWDRFTLAMIFGVCLLLAGLLDAFINRRSFQIFVLCTLVGLSAGLHFQNARNYARRWDTMQSFFWQLTWRAPQIEPGTILLTDDWPFDRSTDNSLTAPLNWTYAPDFSGDELPYLIMDISTRLGINLPALESGQAVYEDFRVAEFSGSTSEMILFYYSPPACVRFLNPAVDGDIFRYPATLQRALPLSDLDRIIAAPQIPAQPPEVLGRRNPHEWCYYYQQADLAVQQGSFETAAALGDEALALNRTAHSAYEYLPFIEAYAKTGQWENAHALTSQAYAQQYTARPALCRLWDNLQQDTSSAPPGLITEIQAEINCR